jgi:hypothetical protein
LLPSHERLLEEVAKRDIVCANRHVIRTYAQRGAHWARRRSEGMLIVSPRRIPQRRRAIPRRDFLLALRDRPCGACGKRLPPYVMQFDHRDLETKAFHVTSS